jgi:hypothetical protein
LDTGWEPEGAAGLTEGSADRERLTELRQSLDPGPNALSIRTPSKLSDHPIPQQARFDVISVCLTQYPNMSRVLLGWAAGLSRWMAKGQGSLTAQSDRRGTVTTYPDRRGIHAERGNRCHGSLKPGAGVNLANGERTIAVPSGTRTDHLARARDGDGASRSTANVNPDNDRIRHRALAARRTRGT